MANGDSSVSSRPKPVTERQVIVYWNHLSRPHEVTFHSWAKPGVTGCGRRWFFVKDYISNRGFLGRDDAEFQAVPLHIDHAEMIGVPCHRCYPE